MSAQHAEIHGLFDALAEAWGRGDAAAYARCFTMDADYIAFDGQWSKGRADIERSHAEVFDFMRGSKLAFGSRTLHDLAPGLVLAIAEGAALLPWQTEIKPGRLSINTSVVMQTPDGWRMRSFQNARISPKPIPKGLFGAALKFAMRLMPKRSIAKQPTGFTVRR